jgi:hypothetical protein
MARQRGNAPTLELNGAEGHRAGPWMKSLFSPRFVNSHNLLYAALPYGCGEANGEPPGNFSGTLLSDNHAMSINTVASSR